MVVQQFPITRRRLLAGSAATAAGALLAACSGGGGITGGSGGKTTLQVTVWLGADELAAMKKLAGEFTKSNPNIAVQFINIVNGGPYGETKLETMIAGGTAPDVMMLNSGQFESFASRGALLQLDDLVKKDKVDTGTYWPEAATGVKFDDKMYGLPKDISNVQVYLNTKLFSQTGVALPDADWSWSDYQSAATELTSKLNTGAKTTKWGTVLVNADWSWTPFVWTNGGQVYSGQTCQLTDPKAVQALDFYFGLVTKEKAAPTPAALASFGAPGTAEIDAFVANTIGFGIFGPWMRPGLIATKGLDWAVRPIPKGPQGEAPVVPIYTDMWGISANSKHQEEAWTLIKWLAGETGQKAWLDIYGGRSISPIKSLAMGDEWLNYGGADHRADNQSILDQLNPSRDRKPIVAFGNGTQAENLWDNEFKVVLAGQESVQKAASNVCSRLPAMLGKGS